MEILRNLSRREFLALSALFLSSCGNDSTFPFNETTEQGRFAGSLSGPQTPQSGVCTYYPDFNYLADKPYMYAYATPKPDFFTQVLSVRTNPDLATDVVFVLSVGTSRNDIRGIKSFGINVGDFHGHHSLYYSWGNWAINFTSIDGKIPDNYFDPNKIIKP